MSVVVQARVKVRNCTPELLREAAKILSQKFDVRGGTEYLVVDGFYVRVQNGEVVAEGDSAYRRRLNEVAGLVRDAIVAAEIARAAKALGKGVSVRVGEGIALEIYD